MRRQVYEAAKARHPKRWSGKARNWDRIKTFAQLVRNFCALPPLIPTFLLFYIKITIRNLLIINVLYAMSCSSQLLYTRR
jgi:hypothetical protein